MTANRPKNRLLWILFTLITLTLACNLPIVGDGGGEEAERSIQTKVAATLAAQFSTEEPMPTPLATATHTVLPTDTATPPEPDVTFQGVSFSYPDSLANDVSRTVDPGYVDENNPWNIPQHVRFDLMGYPLTDTYHKPQIMVFAVEEFKSVNPQVGESLGDLAAILDAHPEDPQDIGVYHFFNAAQFIYSQEGYVRFQNGRGIRFVSQYGQAAYPIGYPHMFYAFQGVTEDGAYYISVIMPLNHPSLPEAESVTVDEDFYNNYETYVVEVEAQLDEKPPDSFVPSLLELDAMVETLLVESP